MINILEYDPPGLKPHLPDRWDHDTWIVTRKGRIVFEYNSHVYRLVWQRGFVTDGGSVPRIAWRVIGHPLGEWLRDYLVHDAFYACEWASRSECDWLFLELLQEDGCDWFRRNAIWSAVRAAGGSVWSRHERKEVLADRELCPLRRDGVRIYKPITFEAQ